MDRGIPNVCIFQRETAGVKSLIPKLRWGMPIREASLRLVCQTTPAPTGQASSPLHPERVLAGGEAELRGYAVPSGAWDRGTTTPPRRHPATTRRYSHYPQHAR